LGEPPSVHFLAPPRPGAIDYGRAQKETDPSTRKIWKNWKQVNVKPGLSDAKVAMLIAGDELCESKRLTADMAEAFDLGRRSEGHLANDSSVFTDGILIAC
jgi:hypothetical protein